MPKFDAKRYMEDARNSRTATRTSEGFSQINGRSDEASNRGVSGTGESTEFTTGGFDGTVQVADRPADGDVSEDEYGTDDSGGID